jgi:hypothetical protein
MIPHALATWVLSEWLTAQRYRYKAEELMTIADDMVHQETRDVMLQIAAEYRHLADQVELQERGRSQ